MRFVLEVASRLVMTSSCIVGAALLLALIGVVLPDPIIERETFAEFFDFTIRAIATFILLLAGISALALGAYCLLRTTPFVTVVTDDDPS